MQPDWSQRVSAPAPRRALSGSRRSKTILWSRRSVTSLFCTRRLILAALVGVSLFTVPAAAQPASGLADLPRIRTNDLAIALAVRRGYDASPTLRGIVQRLQAADVVVYLDRHNRFRHGEAAHLRFAGSASGLRYVRISLSTRLNERQMTVFVAHELMHAVEIAEAEHVTDERGMRELYCRIGSHTHLGFDTDAAERVTEQVAEELDAAALRDRDER
jgi:hypothetical protein